VLTTAQRQQFSQAERDLDALTGRRVDALLGNFGDLGPSFTAGTLESLPPLVAELADVSAVIGSSAYDLAREQSDAKGRFLAVLADPPPEEMVQASARWALFSTESPTLAVVSARLLATSMRLVRTGSRGSVALSVKRDPARPKLLRVIHGAGCDWCRMLATRDFADTRSGGSFPAHDHCSCTAEPKF
jgi:hypothetical protein